MTQDQAQALYTQHYAGKQAQFGHYYKFTFYWKVATDAGYLLVGFGGSAEDIYSYTFDQEEMVKTLPATLTELENGPEDYQVILFDESQDKPYYGIR